MASSSKQARHGMASVGSLFWIAMATTMELKTPNRSGLGWKAHAICSSRHPRHGDAGESRSEHSGMPNSVGANPGMVADA